VFALCVACEQVVRVMLKCDPIGKHTAKKVHMQALQKALDRRLHLSLGCACHAASLCSLIIQRYCTIRLHYALAASLDTDSTLRGRLHRLIVVQNV
jgi:hypothetical protein